MSMIYNALILLLNACNVARIRKEKIWIYIFKINAQKQKYNVDIVISKIFKGKICKNIQKDLVKKMILVVNNVMDHIKEDKIHNIIV